MTKGERREGKAEEETKEDREGEGKGWRKDIGRSKRGEGNETENEGGGERVWLPHSAARSASGQTAVESKFKSQNCSLTTILTVIILPKRPGFTGL